MDTQPQVSTFKKNEVETVRNSKTFALLSKTEIETTITTAVSPTLVKRTTHIAVTVRKGALLSLVSKTVVETTETWEMTKLEGQILTKYRKVVVTTPTAY